jgi:hypothetical protein
LKGKGQRGGKKKRGKMRIDREEKRRGTGEREIDRGERGRDR